MVPFRIEFRIAPVAPFVASMCFDDFHSTGGCPDSIVKAGKIIKKII